MNDYDKIEILIMYNLINCFSIYTVYIQYCIYTYNKNFDNDHNYIERVFIDTSFFGRLRTIWAPVQLKTALRPVYVQRAR